MLDTSQRGNSLNKYKKSITGKCFYDNIAGAVFALSFTLWPLLFVAFSFN